MASCEDVAQTGAAQFSTRLMCLPDELLLHVYFALAGCANHEPELWRTIPPTVGAAAADFEPVTWHGSCAVLRDVLNLAASCKRLHLVADTLGIWRFLYRSRWPTTSHLPLSGTKV